VLPKNFLSAKLLVLLTEDTHALPASVMLMPSVVNCAKMQALCTKQHVIHVLLNTSRRLKALRTFSFTFVSLQLLIDKKILLQQPSVETNFPHLVRQSLLTR
jgi:hypothetical protein